MNAYADTRLLFLAIAMSSFLHRSTEGKVRSSPTFCHSPLCEANNSSYCLGEAVIEVIESEKERSNRHTIDINEVGTK